MADGRKIVGFCQRHFKQYLKMGSPLDWLKALLELSARHIFALVAAVAGVLLFSVYVGPRLGIALPENVRLVLVYGVVGLFFWGVASALFSMGEGVRDRRSQGKRQKAYLVPIRITP